ncbi:hypothetical protein CR513_61305, partial [Mucuna pruriens]
MALWPLPLTLNIKWLMTVFGVNNCRSSLRIVACLFFLTQFASLIVICNEICETPCDGIKMEEIGIVRKLASSGYAVFAMDYAGFPLSKGHHYFIPSFDLLVNNVIEHYSKSKELMDLDLASTYFCCINLRSLPSFLFGQAMRGAVALKIRLKQPKAWEDVTAYNVITYKDELRL